MAYFSRINVGKKPGESVLKSEAPSESKKVEGDRVNIMSVMLMGS